MSLPIPVHDGTYQTWKERSEYFERLRAAVAAMPQVVSAGISTNATPPSNGGDSTLVILGSSALEKPVARSNFISPEYFPLLHIPITQGRVWNHDETMRGAALAVINQSISILRDVRAELVRVDREQQVMRVRDLQGWIRNLPEYAQQQLVARLFGIFSILALALSAVGSIDPMAAVRLE